MCIGQSRCAQGHRRQRHRRNRHLLLGHQRWSDPVGQQCWDFGKAGNLSTDWAMTIDADGNFTLSWHFPKA